MRLPLPLANRSAMPICKSADFFDVEKFPTMSFKSKLITREGDGELAVTRRPDDSRRHPRS